MGTVKALRVGANGQAQTVEVDEEEVRQAVAEAEAKATRAQSTPLAPASENDALALAWLEEQEKQAGPSIIQAEIGGKMWYLKKLDAEEVDMALLLVPRGDDNSVNFHDASIWPPIRAAFLFAGLASGLDDPRPVMSLQVARRYVASRAVAPLVLDLYEQLRELNPDFLPFPPGPEEAVNEIATEPETTKQSASNGDTGPSSSAIPGSASPSLSLIGSASSEPTAPETGTPLEKSPGDSDSTGST